MADADPKIDTMAPRVAAANVIETVDAPEAKPRRWGLIALMAAVPLLLILVAGYFYLTGGRYESTDNAYIAQDTISISPDVSGRIVKVNVQENQRVKAGDLLFEIDPEPYRIALEEAHAAIATARVDVSTKATDSGSAAADIESANADIALAQATYERQNALWKKGFTTKASLDAAQHEVLAARAPRAGIVSQTSRLQVGNITPSGVPALSLVVSDTPWVTANFKETQLAKMRVGQPVELTFDAYPNVKLCGKVDSIGAGTGSSESILPAQNANGNWVKVTQRVPVRIAITCKTDRALITGLSTDVTVDTQPNG